MLLFIIIRFKKTICTEKRQTLHKPVTRNPNPNSPSPWCLGPSGARGVPIIAFAIRQRIRPSRRSYVVAGARPCLPGVLLICSCSCSCSFPSVFVFRSYGIAHRAFGALNLRDHVLHHLPGCRESVARGIPNGARVLPPFDVHLADVHGAHQLRAHSHA